MRMVFKIAVIAAVLIFLVPSILYADQLPAPLEKDIFPGVTHLNYAGQHFRFETTVIIHVSLLSLGPTELQMKLKAYPQSGPSGGGQAVSPSDQLTIVWEDWGSDVYNGTPPAKEWTGILDTESGFTEK